MKKLAYLLLAVLLFGFNYAYSGNLKKSAPPKTETLEQKSKELEQELKLLKKRLLELKQKGKELENNCKLMCENICKKIHPENDCKNACSFACEPIRDCPFSYANKINKCNSIGSDLLINMGICLLKESVDYCSNLCRSYLNCKLECINLYFYKPEFCNRVCEFNLNWTYLGFDGLNNIHFFRIEDVNQNIVKVWKKEIYSEKGKQNFIKNLVQKN
jgi:hypothetical protein